MAFFDTANRVGYREALSRTSDGLQWWTSATTYDKAQMLAIADALADQITAPIRFETGTVTAQDDRVAMKTGGMTLCVRERAECPTRTCTTSCSASVTALSSRYANTATQPMRQKCGPTQSDEGKCDCKRNATFRGLAITTTEIQPWLTEPIKSSRALEAMKAGELYQRCPLRSPWR